MNIYVGQLPYSVTEEELREMFLQFGEVSSLNLIMDRYSGQSKGFGFIEMPNNSEADQAIKGLNKSMLKGREIKVNQSEERRNKKKTFRNKRY
ncbi:MAG: RNA recognition motif domain-containing protein [Desulfobulbales bacterium]